MTMLNEVTSITKKRKRVGRGGDRGGTSGKGHKGQRARSGPKIGYAFEGGQMPLTRRLPKRGFTNNRFRDIYEIVNLEQLNNKFESGSVINKEALIEKRVIKGIRGSLVKILGHGSLEKKFIVHADAFSEAAQQAITDKGGEVHKTER